MRGMSRGFLRLYLLKLIGKAPAGISGYALMKQIEEETGFWRPSPGSIYPLLGALEESGLIQHRVEGDKKFYSLTEKGRESLSRARTAREEAMAGVRRSISVLGKLFGEDVEADLMNHLDWVHRRIPHELRRSLHELREVITTLLRQNLPPEELENIDEILRKATEELRGYVTRN